jgi:hypothetical protein
MLIAVRIDWSQALRLGQMPIMGSNYRLGDLPDWPRGPSLPEAARYVAVSAETFLKYVKVAPRKIGTDEFGDRHAIDAWFGLIPTDRRARIAASLPLWRRPPARGAHHGNLVPGEAVLSAATGPIYNLRTRQNPAVPWPRC